MKKVNLAEAFARVDELYTPKIIGALNGQHVKISKVKGEFVWHQHENEDELFLVTKGELTIHLRDRDIVLGPGEMFIVPRGVEHCPAAVEETHTILFEPAGTLNTGNLHNDLTVEEPEVLS